MINTMQDAQDGGPGQITRDPRPAYEAPQITALGSVLELTLGIVPITTDGVAPGSAL